MTCNTWSLRMRVTWNVERGRRKYAFHIHNASASECRKAPTPASTIAPVQRSHITTSNLSITNEGTNATRCLKVCRCLTAALWRVRDDVMMSQRSKGSHPTLSLDGPFTPPGVVIPSNRFAQHLLLVLAAGAPQIADGQKQAQQPNSKGTSRSANTQVCARAHMATTNEQKRW